MKLDAVFEGGGVKGIGLAGALKSVEDHGYQVENVAGTSAGSIVAALLAARYTADEIKGIINEVDFSKLTDLSGLGRLPLVGVPLNLILNLGVFDGEYFLQLIRKLLKDKGITTFRDLRMPDYDDDPRYRYRLRVVVSDVSRGLKVVLPQEIDAYGIAPDDLEVAMAVRMSMSIPFFFKPVRLRVGGQHCQIVDGGLLSDFPVDLFDSTGIPEWPTFGFRLVQGGQPAAVPHQIGGPISMARALFATAMESNDARYVQTHKFVRSIMIDTLGISSTNFQLSPDQKDELYKSGLKAAEDFLSTWDWEAYKELFRSGAPVPTRRETMTAELEQPATAAQARRRKRFTGAAISHRQRYRGGSRNGEGKGSGNGRDAV